MDAAADDFMLLKELVATRISQFSESPTTPVTAITFVDSWFNNRARCMKVVAGLDCGPCRETCVLRGLIPSRRAVNILILWRTA